MDQEKLSCPVCQAACSLLDVVDLNKSCEELRGMFLPLAAVPVYYAICARCGFCFAPEMHAWSLAKFEETIYNQDYILVDPDYVDERPRANAGVLQAAFPNLPETVRHLDYGGGNGRLVSLLREGQWQSLSYDPFVDRDTRVAELGKFSLITAFEVFEHVPDVASLMADLRGLLTEDGLILFSTLLSDGQITANQRINWWYASPRNGHISLFSRTSLALLGQQSGFNFGSFSDGLHIYFKTVPAWASHLIRLG